MQSLLYSRPKILNKPNQRTTSKEIILRTGEPYPTERNGNLPCCWCIINPDECARKESPIKFRSYFVGSLNC